MKNKFILATILIVAMSSVLMAGTLHPVFAQTKLPECSPGTCSSDSTGASNTKPTTASNPEIKLSPTHGPPGSSFNVDGSGFTSSAIVIKSVVTVTDPFTHKDIVSLFDSPGKFDTQINVPSNANPGNYVVTVKWSKSMKTINDPKGGISTVTDYHYTTFKVDGQGSKTTNTNVGHPNPLPPPPPPLPPTTPTNTATGGSSSSLSLTLNPTSGPPGTVVSLKGTGFFSGDLSLYMGNTKVSGSAGSISGEGDGMVTGEITIPTSAQPGQITISLESPDATAIAFFTVTGNTKTTLHTTPANTLKTPQTNNPKPGAPVNNGKSTLTPNTVTNSNTSPNSAKPSPNTITKRPSGHPQNSGVTFQVIKGVDGGDAKPQDFSFTVTLTGPSGTAKYPLSLDAEQGDFTAHSSFNLDLPQGSPLSEGTYKIVETDSMGYDTTYSKGCSGTYDNEGYMHICEVVNTKPGDSSYDRQTRVWTNPLPEPQPQPGGKLPTSNTIGKSALPTTPTKPTLPTTSKSTISAKPTLPTTKSTGTLTSKIPTVSSCPAGSFAISGKCLSKGAVVGILR